jgi:hypothetical protein
VSLVRGPAVCFWVGGRRGGALGFGGGAGGGGGGGGGEMVTVAVDGTALRCFVRLVAISP